MADLPGAVPGSMVDQQHPDYANARSEWDKVRDCLEGEQAIKDKGEAYLPMPDGFRSDAARTADRYNAYKCRAKFPEWIGPIVRGMSGILNKIEPEITVPDSLKEMLENSTLLGDPIEAVYRRIVRELLITGRCVLLTDMPGPEDVLSKPRDIPYLCFYEAERLINWSKDRDFYVLDETRLERERFTWTPVGKYRVLELVNGQYQVSVWDKESPLDPEPVFPTARGGGGPFTEIPLTVMNSIDVCPELGEIPLKGVVQSQLCAYRLDADYRHQLFMSGQETFVIVGIDSKDSPPVLGASVILTLPQDSDAKYVSPSCAGIEAHKVAIDGEQKSAAIAGSRMFASEEEPGSDESGTAKKLRFAGETATLTSIGQSAAQGLEKALRHAVMFMGGNPDDVVVKPSAALVDASLTPTEAVSLMSLWTGGAISKRTLYENLQKGDIASKERTLEEEQDLIEDEMPPPAPQVSPLGGGASAGGPKGSLNKPPSNDQIAQFKAKPKAITHTVKKTVY